MNPDPQRYKAWLDANADKADTDNYKAVEAAYNEASRIAAAKQEWAAGNPVERAGVLAANIVPKLQETAIAMGVKGAPAAAGEMLGRRFGGPVGARVGGALGAGVGSVAEQVRQRGIGGIRAGELGADVLAGAIQPKSLMGAGATGAALDVARQAIDEGQVNLKNVSVAGAGAMAGAAAGRAMAGKQPDPLDVGLNEYRYQAWKDVEKYGVKVSPMELDRGLGMATRVAGPNQLATKAAHNNQLAWQKMAREQVGLPTDTTVLAFKPSYRGPDGKKVKGTIDAEIEKNWGPYKEIEDISKSISKEYEDFKAGKSDGGKFLKQGLNDEQIGKVAFAADALESLKSARHALKQALRKKEAGDPNAGADIELQKGRIQRIESTLEEVAQIAGKPELMERLAKARARIAELHALDNATTAYGAVDPKLLYSQMESGVPLTGNLQKMANFYAAFRGSGSEFVQAGPISAQGQAVNYMARNVVQGNPEGGIAAAVPMLSESVADFLLSAPMQRRFMQQRVNPVETGASAFLRQAGILGSPQLDPFVNRPQDASAR